MKFLRAIGRRSAYRGRVSRLLGLDAAIKDEEEMCRRFEEAEDQYRKENETAFLTARRGVAKDLELKFKEIDERDLFRRFKYDVGGRFTLSGIVAYTERHFFSDDVIYVDVKGWGETYRIKCLVGTLPNKNSGQKIKVTGEKISDMTIKVSSVY